MDEFAVLCPWCGHREVSTVSWHSRTERTLDSVDVVTWPVVKSPGPHRCHSLEAKA